MDLGLAEISFIVFMGLGFILAWEIRSRYQLVYWLVSILVPLALLTAMAYVFSGGSAYRAGQITAECLISTICTMLMMIIVFYAKPQRKKQKPGS